MKRHNELNMPLWLRKDLESYAEGKNYKEYFSKDTYARMKRANLYSNRAKKDS